MGGRLWNTKGETDYAGFLRRSDIVLDRLKRKTHPFTVHMDSTPTGGSMVQFVGQVAVSAKASRRGIVIRMRSDGEVPMLADRADQCVIDRNRVVTVQAFRNHQPIGETEFLSMKKVVRGENLARGAKVWASTPEDPQFPASIVTNGLIGDPGSFWLAYPLPASLTIDLGGVKPINRIEILPFWQAQAATKYEILLSDDNQAWVSVIKASDQTQPPTELGYVHRFSARKARFIRVKFTGSDQYPPSMVRIHQIRAYLETQ